MRSCCGDEEVDSMTTSAVRARGDRAVHANFRVCEASSGGTAHILRAPLVDARSKASLRTLDWLNCIVAWTLSSAPHNVMTNHSALCQLSELAYEIEVTSTARPNQTIDPRTVNFPRRWTRCDRQFRARGVLQTERLRVKIR